MTRCPSSGSPCRAEKRVLREKMRALGLGHREIAAEFARLNRGRAVPPGAKPTAGALREAAAQIYGKAE